MWFSRGEEHVSILWVDRGSSLSRVTDMRLTETDTWLKRTNRTSIVSFSPSARIWWHLACHTKCRQHLQLRDPHGKSALNKQKGIHTQTICVWSISTYCTYVRQQGKSHSTFNLLRQDVDTVTSFTPWALHRIYRIGIVLYWNRWRSDLFDNAVGDHDNKDPEVVVLSENIIEVLEDKIAKLGRWVVIPGHPRSSKYAHGSYSCQFPAHIGIGM